MPSPIVIGAAVAVLIVIVLVVVFSSGPKVPSAAELAAMDATAIAAIAPNVLKKIAAADLAALSVIQKGALIEEQVGALTTAQVDALLLTFTPGQWGFLTGEQVEGILETQIRALPNEVISVLTAQVLGRIASKLSSTQIDLVWTSTENIFELYPNFSKEQVETTTLSRLESHGNIAYASLVLWLLQKGPGRVSWLHSSLLGDSVCRNLLGPPLSTYITESVDALRERCSGAGFNY